MTLLTKTEAEEADEMAQVQFENTLFASNYPMWRELYGKKQDKEREEAENDIDWARPGSPDFEMMLDEMRTLGLEVNP